MRSGRSRCRRSSISAQPCVLHECRAAASARSRVDCPRAGDRYEPLRKQSRFEGSFRQRRAALLRLVADGVDACRRAPTRRRGLTGARRSRRVRRRPRPPACLDPVVHPDVRLDVTAHAVLDDERRERAREDVLAVRGEAHLRPRLPVGDGASMQHRPRRGPRGSRLRPLVRCAARGRSACRRRVATRCTRSIGISG